MTMVKMIDVDNGKYTFVIDQTNYELSILRYAEPWISNEELIGQNAILALLLEIEELKKDIDSNLNKQKD